MRALPVASLSSALLAIVVAACSSGSTDSAAGPAMSPAGSGGAAGDIGGSGGQAGYIGSIAGTSSMLMPSPGLSGVYVTSPPLTTGGPTISDDVYALPTFDGVVLRLRWDSFEPKPGMFDFYELDLELQRARLAGKKVALALLAGGSTPPWIYDGGMAKELVFVIPGTDASGDDCQSLHVPEPWDSGFQTAFAAAIAQLGLHLTQQPDVLADVRLVLLTGIGSTAEDLELPSANGGMTPLGCQLTATDAAWQKAGYRPSKVKDVWMSLLTAYAAAFPTTTLLVPTVRAGFPGIDDAGALVDPASVDPTAAMLDAATTMLGTRLAVQGADLTSDSTDPRVAVGVGKGAIPGFRTNDFLGKNGAGCGSDDPSTAVPCTDSVYETILQHGVDLGGKFLTVHVIEATSFPGSIEDAQTALRGGP